MAVVELTTADNDQTIRVHPDDEIVIRLPENPTTGFRWQADLVDPILTETGDSFALADSPLIGTGGTHEFRFGVAASEGKGRLALKLGQPWEGGASVAERFAVDVEVEP